ncbi:MAG: histidine phosphatase family protein [Candidatus Komeilibacteria bacterium]|nr:histidine phosphatase family protein [Candidatus Komeilibacteria bacterium]
MPKNLTPYQKIKPLTTGPYTGIYLIRHCNPDYPQMSKVGDIAMPLSTIGIKQRRYLTNRLRKIKFTSIYTSEFRRAQETADLIARQKKIIPIVEKRLNEINWTDWYKMKYFNMTERKRRIGLKYYKQLDKDLDKYQKRSRRVMTDIYKANKGKNALVFCHGNVIRSLVTDILNADVIGFLSIEIDQSSVTKLTIDKHGYVKINYINSITHLRDILDEDLFTMVLN